MISGNSSSGSNKNLVRTIRMDFTVKKGDTFSYVYDVSSIDSNGTEVTADLTGYSAQMHLKKKRSDTHYFTAMAAVISVVNGTITFSKSAEDMREISADTYWYDLEIKDADSINVTWIEGKFKVLQDITQWVDEVEKSFEYLFELSLNFVKGFGRRYPVILQYSQSLWTNKDIAALRKKFAVVFRLSYGFLVGFGYRFRTIFGSTVAFAILSTTLRLTTIMFLQTLSFLVGRNLYYKVGFTSSYDFAFLQILIDDINFSLEYSFTTMVN